MRYKILTGRPEVVQEGLNAALEAGLGVRGLQFGAMDVAGETYIVLGVGHTESTTPSRMRCKITVGVPEEMEVLMNTWEGEGHGDFQFLRQAPFALAGLPQLAILIGYTEPVASPDQQGPGPGGELGG